jgi:outer membrane immunogenic protein
MMSVIRKAGLMGASAFAAMSIANAASAADLAARPYVPAPPVPVFSWTGFYIGGQVGTGWGTSQTDVDVGNTFIGAPVNQTVNQLIAGNLNLSVPLPQVQMNGFLGGGQVGYNWQSGVMVYGIEGDILASGLKGKTGCFLVLNCTNEIKSIADITGRVGFTVGDRGLLYVKGGAAWADASVGINQSVSVASTLGPGFVANGAINGSASKDVFGGTFGAGIEYAFMPGWSAKLEYDYFDFGSQSMVVPVTAGGGVAIGGGAPVSGSIGIRTPVSFQEQVHTIRVGVNYHFN